MATLAWPRGGATAELYKEASTADRGLTTWTFLRDRHAGQLVNTCLPFGAALPTGPGAGHCQIDVTVCR